MATQVSNFFLIICTDLGPIHHLVLSANVCVHTRTQAPVAFTPNLPVSGSSPSVAAPSPSVAPSGGEGSNVVTAEEQDAQEGRSNLD